ncbi:homocysteine S-methyltransferase 3 [Citrus sinensis]|uniref:Homocysteine S-methyltransferase 3 n=1 Tax=Citrus sinensis TaxID=2711 RepID=A0ACB8I677_CITSI|nr:homocysteine S-methyltransferase 3 [Citrus sinensis]
MVSGSNGTTSFMTDFLQKCGGYSVVDGGFATELERHGADLNDPLWSAKCLVSSPHLVRKMWHIDTESLIFKSDSDVEATYITMSISGALCAEIPCEVHLDYLDAGANIIITASYQATIQGFEAKGFSTEEAEALLRRSVEIACEAREIYYDRCMKDSCDFTGSGRISSHPVLVAASVGSYGAYLADGSEYSGDYGDAVSLETLKEFHRRRVLILANSGADLIAFETIPNKLEAKAYAELLEEEGITIPAWFSFNSKDGINVVSGDSILECASIADSCEQVVAVGINCTAPRFIHGLILSVRKVTSKPVIIYPNSGETYNAELKKWVESTGVRDEDFVSYIGKWRDAGASLFGGCCRTTPNTIKAISRVLSNKSLPSANLNIQM